MYKVYMTDGSGIDHREYRYLRPTVWALKSVPVVGLFIFLLF